MEQQQIDEEYIKGPLLDKDHGYYSSCNLALSPAEVFKLCKDETLYKKLIRDLPIKIENFLNLTLLSSEKLNSNQYKIVLSNKPESKVSGELVLLIKKAPANRGSILTSEAKFNKLNFKDEGPSAFMNFILKRMKSFVETGEIPTTKGQPSGRHELKTLH